MSISILRRVVAASSVAFSAAAFAQVPPTLTITFDSGSVVPVGSAATVGAGLLLALVAFWMLRKRGAATRSLLAIAAALVVATGGLVATNSEAGAPVLVTLTTSPTTVAISAGTWNVVNGTAGAVIIRAVTLQNAANYVLNTTQTTCTPSISVAAGASCTVVVDFAAR